MRITAIMILVLSLSVVAHAQEERSEDRVQVRAITGWAGFGDEGGLIHHGVVGGSMDFRLLAGLRAGTEVLYHVGPGQDRDISFLPTLSYEFRRLKRVAPFVSAGYGVLRHSGGARWSNSLTVGLGAGVKIALSERLFIAPEIRSGWEPVARAMVSIGYRF